MNKKKETGKIRRLQPEDFRRHAARYSSEDEPEELFQETGTARKQTAPKKKTATAGIGGFVANAAAHFIGGLVLHREAHQILILNGFF